MQKECGVENAKYNQVINEANLKSFSYVRSKCLGIITDSSEGHFLEVREKALDLLFLILKNDPYGTELTAMGLIENLKTLKNIIENIEDHPPSLQPKCFSAYNAALESVICHYYTETLGALPQKLKQELKEMPKLAEKLNKHNRNRLNPSFEYNAACARIAPNYLTTEKTKELKFFTGFINLLKTCHSAASLNFAETWTDFKNTIKDLESGKKWYLGVLLQKGIFGQAIQDFTVLNALQEVVYDWGFNKTLGFSSTNWKFFFGSVENLTQIVIQSENPEIQKNAFYGTQNLSNKNKQQVGVLDFIHFDLFSSARSFANYDLWSLFRWRYKMRVKTSLKKRDCASYLFKNSP